MKTLSAIVTLGSVFLINACSSGEVSVPENMQVSQLQNETVLKDRPAFTAFANLAALVQQGRHSTVGFGVYSVKAPSALFDRVATRAAQLGLPANAGIVSKAEVHRAGVQNGTWELTLNEFNDGEAYVDISRNHVGAGVPESALPPDSEFVAAALGHATKGLATTLAENSTYPLRVRKYFNAHASPQGSQVDGVYQVAVAFNTTVDGLPIIGDGGKIAINMAVDKSIIAHEHVVRRKGALLHVVTGGADLVTPGAAEAAVNARIDSRGVDRSKFRVSRREFGYFARGRNSIQNVLVPHYAFFLEPLPGTLSKILVEIEPATNDRKILDLIAADEKAESARKAVHIAAQSVRTPK